MKLLFLQMLVIQNDSSEPMPRDEFLRQLRASVPTDEMSPEIGAKLNQVVHSMRHLKLQPCTMHCAQIFTVPEFENIESYLKGEHLTQKQKQEKPS